MDSNKSESMEAVASKWKSKSAKIRALKRAGYDIAGISKFLEIRYQFAYNVLKAAADRMSPEEEPILEKDRNNLALTWSEAKAALSRKYDIPVEAIEINVKI